MMSLQGDVDQPAFNSCRGILHQVEDHPYSQLFYTRQTP